MKRTVMLTIDDDRAVKAEAYLVDADGEDLTKLISVPIPPDDQLMRDLDVVTTYIQSVCECPQDIFNTPIDAAARIRAALEGE